MSAILNGSSSDLYAASAPATDYPLAMSCWCKLTGTARSQPCPITLNRSSANHSIAIRFHRDASNNFQPRALASAGGANIGQALYGDYNSFPLNVWHHVLCIFYSSNSRQVWLNGTPGTDDGGTAATINIDLTRIGVLAESGSESLFTRWTGNLADVAIWSGAGVSSMGQTEATALASGQYASTVQSELLVLYQPLLAGLDETGSIGPMLGNDNVTFNSGDHPTLTAPVLFKTWYYQPDSMRFGR